MVGTLSWLNATITLERVPPPPIRQACEVDRTWALSQETTVVVIHVSVQCTFVLFSALHAIKGASTGRGHATLVLTMTTANVMACHIRIIPPLEKAKKQEMSLTRLSPIPTLKSTFFNGMGLSLVNGISCFLAFSRGGII